MSNKTSAGLFPALLKHGRRAHGMSQLDLALTAGVSARHVSFLETGRARPSEDMVLRLGAALGLPLRDRNRMLLAAGFSEAFDEPELDGELSPGVAGALDRMLEGHEPFPMVVMNHRYDVLRTNRGAMALLSQMVAEPEALGTPINAYRLLFDPRLARPFVRNWDLIAHGLIAALHMECLQHPNDERLVDLLRSLHEYPGVPEAWREPVPRPAEAIFTLVLERGDLRLGFVTTVTRFNAPANVTLEELRIESYFPLDGATEETCRRLSALGMP